MEVRLRWQREVYVVFEAGNDLEHCKMVFSPGCAGLGDVA